MLRIFKHSIHSTLLSTKKGCHKKNVWLQTLHVGLPNTFAECQHLSDTSSDSKPKKYPTFQISGMIFTNRPGSLITDAEASVDLAKDWVCQGNLIFHQGQLARGQEGHNNSWLQALLVIKHIWNLINTMKWWRTVSLLGVQFIWFRLAGCASAVSII